MCCRVGCSLRARPCSIVASKLLGLTIEGVVSMLGAGVKVAESVLLSEWPTPHTSTQS